LIAAWRLYHRNGFIDLHYTMIIIEQIYYEKETKAILSVNHKCVVMDSRLK